MSLTSLSVRELLAAFRSSEPTPGGGSASALAGATGASLLAMVAGLPKPNTETESDQQELRSAGQRCTGLALELEALIDRDTEAYDMVVAAFRLPKGTDEEKGARTAAIQRGLRAATEAPLQVMRSCAAALHSAPVMARFGNTNAASDVKVGVGLLQAGLRGARENVEINLPSVKDADFVSKVRAEVAELSATG